jgi:beta-lactamase superfamily II metal-dependent hydrolase
MSVFLNDMRHTCSLFALSYLIIITTHAQEVGKPLPLWQEGYLDVHHINTGHGVSAFYIMPDGTTMIIDAGEMDPNSERIKSARNAAMHPNESRPAHEWIAEYIKRVHPSRTNPSINYALITHFHDDHFGGHYQGAKKSSNGNYYLTGITGVGEYIQIDRLLDRGYPEYNYPIDLRSDSVKKNSSKNKSLEEAYATMLNYWNFIDFQVKHQGMIAEKFKAGVKNQIVLKHKPDAHRNFSVRNIKSNGTIWTGESNKTFEYFPPIGTGSYIPGENQLSNALRIDYGDFRYYAGGDNPGIADLGAPKWNDVETPMTKVIGEVDVAVMDHHGNRDAHNEYNIKTLKPRVWIQQTWSSDHPGHEVLRRITSEYLYPGPRDLFATNMLEANKLVIGPALERSYKSMDGHIVLRVMPGGKTYYVIILNDENEVNEIKAVHGPYETKVKTVPPGQ